jgi:DNA-binding beta-propeller fold protein YncE
MAAALFAAAPTYKVVSKIKIGGMTRWDYVYVDSANHRLYASHMNQVEVIDTASDKLVGTIMGTTGVHGIAIANDLNRGFISDGGDNDVTVFDLKTYSVLGKIKTAEDSDGVIYDPASGKVLVVCGDARVMIPISPDVDPASGKADAAVELGGKPEFLAADGEGKAFINLQDKDQVAVVDTKTMKVINKWPTTPGGSPVGMSIDPAKHRLFIGCRLPSKLLVLNADSGDIVAKVDISGDPDEVFFDNKRHRIYAVCGAGKIDIIDQVGANSYKTSAKVDTAEGARTGFFAADRDRLFVAVPHRGSQQAEIRAYQIE